MSAPQETEILREWRESARFWEKHAQTVRLMFAPVTQALIQDAGIRQGHKVLDVAGGPGEPALTIAEFVGPSGMVGCTDVIPEMVAAAERAAQKRGLKNVQFVHCPADSIPFKDHYFDAAVCRLGVMFFPDPVRGLREMLRVIRAESRVSLAVWAKSETNPFFYTVTNVLSRYVEVSPPTPSAPGAFRFAEPGMLADVLREAGAESVNERVLNFDIEAPISPAKFWEMRSETSGTVRNNLEKLSAEERQQVAREIEESVREFFPNEEMKFPAEMIIVTGSKPE